MAIKDWKNRPNRSTPLSAEAIEDLEARLTALGGGGGGLPPGGDTDDVLGKASDIDGDVLWFATAALSNDDPLPPGVTAPGTSNDAARSDHSHPMTPFGNQVLLADGYLTWPLGRGGPGGDVTQGREVAYPVVFDKSRAVNIGMNITTPGAAGGGGAPVIRIGVRADADGLPGELVADLGTIDGTDSDLVSKGPWTPEPSVRYWVTYTAQGLPGTAITVSSVGEHIGQQVPMLGSVNPAQITAIVQSGITGALPSSFTPAGVIPFGGALYIEPS